MTQTEQRAVLTPLLRAATLAVRIEKRLTVADQVGWPADVSADLAVARGHMRTAKAALVAAQVRERWARRQGR
jgi:hypothetical protein